MAREIAHHTDAELYRLMRNGDRTSGNAFDELYRRLAPRVFKYCRRIIGNQELAEDIFQETFVRFYGSAATEREMTNVMAYILRIARNLSLNARNSKYYGLVSLEGIELHERENHYENRELAEIVAAAVECIQIEFREAFVLREYDGLSYADIAEVLDISISTVKIRIYRAKQAIRKIIAPYLADLAQHGS
jgi:RNA polymerase sigma-70 factor (ECF subfamily)